MCDTCILCMDRKQISKKLLMTVSFEGREKKRLKMMSGRKCLKVEIKTILCETSLKNLS